MFKKICLTATAVAIIGTSTASGAVVLNSVFNTTGATDVSPAGTGTGLNGVDGSSSVTVPWTSDFSETASDLTAISPQGGFVYGVGNASIDRVTINSNLNAAGFTLSPRGYQFDFTPAGNYSLDYARVFVAQVNGSGGNQNFTSDTTFSLTQGASTLFSNTRTLLHSSAGSNGNDINGALDTPLNPLPGTNDEFGIFSRNLHDLSGITLNAGTTYTFSVTSNNLTLGGAYMLYDNFLLEGTAVPEPSSALALGMFSLVGATFSRRRRS